MIVDTTVFGSTSLSDSRLRGNDRLVCNMLP